MKAALASAVLLALWPTVLLALSEHFSEEVYVRPLSDGQLLVRLRDSQQYPLTQDKHPCVCWYFSDIEQAGVIACCSGPWFAWNCNGCLLHAVLVHIVTAPRTRIPAFAAPCSSLTQHS